MPVSHHNKKAASGFTLIEVVVALGIFGIGVLALIHVQSENLKATVEIRDRVIADIIAENILVESYVEADGAPSKSGSGELRMAEQTWSWTRESSGTVNQSISRIDVSVARGSDGMTLSTMTAFKGVQ